MSALLVSNARADIGDTQTFDAPEILEGWYCGVDCLVNGWNGGNAAPDQGDNGIGDDAVLYTATGGRGFHFFTWQNNTAADFNFLGDFLSAGVVAVQFRARHSGEGEDLVLRAYLFSEFVGDVPQSAISNGSVTIPNTPEGSNWQTYEISLREADLAAGPFAGVPTDQTDILPILSAVAQFSLRHDPANTGPGTPVPVASAVYIDDIVLLRDTDGDGVLDGDDFCPDTAFDDIVDEVGCSNAQVDADSDGVCDIDAASGGPAMCAGIDQCPGTVIPEAVPTAKLGWYRWTLDNPDGTFTQRRRRNWGPSYNFTVQDTRGCSCEQIIDEIGYRGWFRDINRQYGCSTWIILRWIWSR
jgi:hypothetical protein